MSEKPRNIEFHHTPYGQHDFEYEPVGGLADMFKNADYLKAEVIKNYVQQIVEQVNQSSNTDTQKACVIDLLRDQNIKKLLEQKQQPKNDTEETDEDKKDKEEVERMTFYWVKRIKKQIIDDLKNYLPDDLYFFVKEKQKDTTTHFNQKSSLIDARTNQEYFFKESDIYSVQIKKEREDNLKKIREAVANLEKTGAKMPFVIAPQMIGQTKDSRLNSDKSLSYISNQEDIATIADLLIEEIDDVEYEDKELDETNTKKVLSSILDCLLGAQFLAKNGLTLTDLNTIPIGKNLGINNKNKRGSIFDLDGLQEVGATMHYLVCPTTNKREIVVSLLAPEYKLFATSQETVATAESMIWEIGDSISRLAEIQRDKLYMSPNFFANQKLILVWEKALTFSKKMTAEKPSDRPSFDICIIKLEEIINKLSDQK